jgi:hypothetical protein
VAADAAWCSSNWEENIHIYLVANYPLLVSGLVHPSDWCGLTLLIPCKSLGL